MCQLCCTYADDDSVDHRPLNVLLGRALHRVSVEAAAMVSTTVAATSVHAGVADNVLPQNASVVFNFRSLPGEPELVIVQ